MSNNLSFGHRRVGFFGIGKSNLSLMRLLPEGTEVILRSDVAIDKNDIPESINIKGIYEGRRACEDITEEIIYFSPSVRRDREELKRASARGVIFSSELEEFFSKCPAPIFAVTGSDGKSTTTSLAYSLLKGHFNSPLPVGNIGTPAYEAIGKADAFVAELSSFTLEYLKPRTRRAVITNITPNHLNWHRSFNEYKKAKLSLLSHTEEAVVVDDGGILSDFARGRGVYAIVGENYERLKKEYRAEVYITLENGYIRRCGEKLLPIERVAHLMPHNVMNLMCAVALTDGYSTKETLEEVAESFKGLPHRAELVLSVDGIDFIDSSIDTTPTRVITTLSSLGRQVILILGGRGKGAGYDTLRPYLSRYAKKCIIYGEDRDVIKREIFGACDISTTETFEDAVLSGVASAEKNDTVLLSPAATSYDLFSSFEERGDRFFAIVKSYYKQKT